MKTKSRVPFDATVLLFVIVCCIEFASGKPTDENGTPHNPEVQQDEGARVEGQAVLSPGKPLSLTARLALLENARREGNGITKKRPTLNAKKKKKKSRPKRSSEMLGGGGVGLLNNELKDEYESIDPSLFADWSACNVSCGIGYQTLIQSCDDPLGCDSEHGDARRCLGIDCKSPEHLEEQIASSGGGSVSSVAVGFVGGVVITLLAGFGAVHCMKRFGSKDGKDSKTSKSKKGSKRPPKPPPRDGKTKGNDRKKDSKKTSKGGKGKPRKKPDTDSDHTYVDPDELESEDLEISRLRNAPPPPGRKSKKSSKRKKENEYEVPMGFESDYMEIE